MEWCGQTDLKKRRCVCVCVGVGVGGLGGGGGGGGLEEVGRGE